MNEADTPAQLARVLAHALEENDPVGYVGENYLGRVVLDGSYDLVEVARKVLAAGVMGTHS